MTPPLDHKTPAVAELSSCHVNINYKLPLFSDLKGIIGSYTFVVTIHIRPISLHIPQGNMACIIAKPTKQSHPILKVIEEVTLYSSAAVLVTSTESKLSDFIAHPKKSCFYVLHLSLGSLHLHLLWRWFCVSVSICRPNSKV